MVFLFSMEESDELCARLGIMVNGQFQCFGPTRYLKQKFGQGFTVLVKLNTHGKTKDESEAVMTSFKDHIISQFDGCVVKDEHKVHCKCKRLTYDSFTSSTTNHIRFSRTMCTFT